MDGVLNFAALHRLDVRGLPRLDVPRLRVVQSTLLAQKMILGHREIHRVKEATLHEHYSLSRRRWLASQYSISQFGNACRSFFTAPSVNGASNFNHRSWGNALSFFTVTSVNWV